MYAVQSRLLDAVRNDDPSVLATYRRLLTRTGYATRTEGDPRRLLENGIGPVDLLLLDYKMPGMDGLTLLAELRRREFSAPCILISAWLTDDVRSQAKNLGVSRVLDKPVQLPVLRHAIDELLPLTSGRPTPVSG